MVYVLFFLSGVAALLYQVVWTKALANQFGVSAYAVSTTVSVFMLGLALGSWVFGRLADRVRRPLAAYGLLELGIGASALASLALLRAVETAVASIGFSDASGLGFAVLRTVGTSLVLLVPTVLMGGTLPMLAKEVVVTRGAVGRGVGRLYGVNAFGGAVGSVLAGFVLIGWLGLRGSLLVGVGLNVLAAALVVLLVRRRPAAAALDPPAVPPTSRPDVPASSAMRIAFFLAGLTGLAVEVVWTRMLLLNLDSTAQAFSAMLAVCLVGLSLGSVATARLADRVNAVRAYGLTLLLVGASILLCAALWATLGPSASDVARWAVDRMPPSLRGNAAFRLVLCLYQCGLLLLLPTFFMGCSFPFAGRCFARAAPDVGRRLGSAVTLNTIGSMIGPLLCGFWWLPALGIQRTVALCGSIGIVAGAGLLFSSTRIAGRWALAGLASALVLVPWLLPADFVVARTDQRSTGRLLHAEEDVSGSVAVLEIDSGNERCRQLKVGTTSMITDAFACRRYTRLLGHVPMLLHPAPRDAMVICLGAGMTLSAVAAHPDVSTIDCVELSPGVVRAARAYFGEANGKVLEDPRVRVIVNDGRTQLLVSRKTYDVITLEPPPPYDEGVASLYSREFYELCRSRLRPGGMLSQWIPYHCATLTQIRSMLATVQAVFPEATLWEFFDRREYCVIGRLDDAAIPYDRVVQTVLRFSRARPPAGGRHPAAGGPPRVLRHGTAGASRVRGRGAPDHRRPAGARLRPRGARRGVPLGLVVPARDPGVEPGDAGARREPDADPFVREPRGRGRIRRADRTRAGGVEDARARAGSLHVAAVDPPPGVLEAVQTTDVARPGQRLLPVRRQPGRVRPRPKPPKPHPARGPRLTLRASAEAGEQGALAGRGPRRRLVEPRGRRRRPGRRVPERPPTNGPRRPRGTAGPARDVGRRSYFGGAAGVPCSLM